MTEWVDKTSSVKPEPFVKLNTLMHLQNAYIRETSGGYSYKSRKLTNAEYIYVLTHEEGLRPFIEETNDSLDTLDVNDTTLMEAQADTFEQTLGIDDIMEALADIYTEILEIKARL